MYIFLAILGVAVIALVAFIMFSRNAKSVANAKANMILMNEYEKRLLNIATDPKNTEFKAALNRLYEDLKYSDKNGITMEDYKIDSILLRLEKTLASEGDERKEIHAIMDELKTILVRRKAEISDSKRGGF